MGQRCPLPRVGVGLNQTGHEIDTVGHDQAAEIGDDGDEGLLKRHGWTITADGQTTNGTSGSRSSESSPAEHRQGERVWVNRVRTCRAGGVEAVDRFAYP